MLNIIVRIINFLSSFLFSVLLILGAYFSLYMVFYPLLIGLITTTLVLIITRTNIFKIRKFRQKAKKQGVAKSHRKAFAKAIQNRFFSGHIARAFLIGSIAFWYNLLLIIPISIYLALVILATMKTRRARLLKIISSSVLGSVSGVVGVILSNFFL